VPVQEQKLAKNDAQLPGLLVYNVVEPFTHNNNKKRKGKEC